MSQVLTDVLFFDSVRYQVMSISPLDYKTEANKLAELIRQFSV